MNIAVLGTGIMGSGIISTLCNKNYEVHIWNRTYQKANELASDLSRESNVYAHQNAFDAVKSADIIFLVLFDVKSTLSTLDLLVKDAKSNPLLSDKIFIQTATIGIEGAKEVDRFAKSNNLKLIEANMMGSKAQAHSGELVYIVGGNEEYYQKVKTVLDDTSVKQVFCGNNVGDGSVVKLACNMWIAALTAACGQSIKLLKNFDVNPQLFLDVISQATSNSPYAHLKGQKMINDDFSTQFAVEALKKDLALANEALNSVNQNTVLLSILQDLYQNTSKKSSASDDIAAVYKSL